jgi:hypothetical protein
MKLVLRHDLTATTLPRGRSRGRSRWWRRCRCGSRRHLPSLLLGLHSLVICFFGFGCVLRCLRLGLGGLLFQLLLLPLLLQVIFAHGGARGRGRGRRSRIRRSACGRSRGRSSGRWRRRRGWWGCLLSQHPSLKHRTQRQRTQSNRNRGGNLHIGPFREGIIFHAFIELKLKMMLGERRLAPAASSPSNSQKPDNCTKQSSYFAKTVGILVMSHPLQ